MLRPYYSIFERPRQLSPLEREKSIERIRDDDRIAVRDRHVNRIHAIQRSQDLPFAAQNFTDEDGKRRVSGFYRGMDAKFRSRDHYDLNCSDLSVSLTRGRDFFLEQKKNPPVTGHNIIEYCTGFYRGRHEEQESRQQSHLDNVDDVAAYSSNALPHRQNFTYSQSPLSGNVVRTEGFVKSEAVNHSVSAKNWGGSGCHKNVISDSSFKPVVGNCTGNSQLAMPNALYVADSRRANDVLAAKNEELEAELVRAKWQLQEALVSAHKNPNILWQDDITYLKLEGIAVRAIVTSDWLSRTQVSEGAATLQKFAEFSDAVRNRLARMSIRSSDNKLEWNKQRAIEDEKEYLEELKNYKEESKKERERRWELEREKLRKARKSLIAEKQQREEEENRQKKQGKQDFDENKKDGDANKKDVDANNSDVDKNVNAKEEKDGANGEAERECMSNPAEAGQKTKDGDALDAKKESDMAREERFRQRVKELFDEFADIDRREKTQMAEKRRIKEAEEQDRKSAKTDRNQSPDRDMDDILVAHDHNDTKFVSKPKTDEKARREARETAGRKPSADDMPLQFPEELLFEEPERVSTSALIQQLTDNLPKGIRRVLSVFVPKTVFREHEHNAGPPKAPNSPTITPFPYGTAVKKTPPSKTPPPKTPTHKTPNKMPPSRTPPSKIPPKKEEASKGGSASKGMSSKVASSKVSSNGATSRATSVESKKSGASYAKSVESKADGKNKSSSSGRNLDSQKVGKASDSKRNAKSSDSRKDVKSSEPKKNVRTSSLEKNDDSKGGKQEDKRSTKSGKAGGGKQDDRTEKHDDKKSTKDADSKREADKQRDAEKKREGDRRKKDAQRSVNAKSVLSSLVGTDASSGGDVNLSALIGADPDPPKVVDVELNENLKIAIDQEDEVLIELLQDVSFENPIDEEDDRVDRAFKHMYGISLDGSLVKGGKNLDLGGGANNLDPDRGPCFAFEAPIDGFDLFGPNAAAVKRRKFIDEDVKNKHVDLSEQCMLCGTLRRSGNSCISFLKKLRHFEAENFLLRMMAKRLYDKFVQKQKALKTFRAVEDKLRNDCQKTQAIALRTAERLQAELWAVALEKEQKITKLQEENRKLQQQLLINAVDKFMLKRKLQRKLRALRADEQVRDFIHTEGNERVDQQLREIATAVGTKWPKHKTKPKKARPRSRQAVGGLEIDPITSKAEARPKPADAKPKTFTPAQEPAPKKAESKPKTEAKTGTIRKVAEKDKAQKMAKKAFVFTVKDGKTPSKTSNKSESKTHSEPASKTPSKVARKNVSKPGSKATKASSKTPSNAPSKASSKASSAHSKATSKSTTGKAAESKAKAKTDAKPKPKTDAKAIADSKNTSKVGSVGASKPGSLASSKPGSAASSKSGTAASSKANSKEVPKKAIPKK